MPRHTMAQALMCTAVFLAPVAPTAALAIELDVELIEAVKADDRARVERLLEAGVDVSAPQGDGATALHWAVHRGSSELTTLLIRSGANVDTVDDHGVTPLALACLNGSASLVERLLEAGADPALARATGETPLMTAARVGNVDVVRLLRAAGADPAAAESVRGQTALMWGRRREPQRGCRRAARERRRGDRGNDQRIHPAPLRRAAGQRGDGAHAAGRRRRRE